MKIQLNTCIILVETVHYGNLRYIGKTRTRGIDTFFIVGGLDDNCV